MSWKNILEDPKQYMIYLEGRILQGSKEADEKYLKKLFKYRMGRELDLDHPQALNDKLQWLKINDFKPIYTKFADKYAVREYIAQKVGEKYLVPLLGVWNEVDDIDFNSLPDQFVLKCTHDSGGVVICKDKSNFDKETASLLRCTRILRRCGCIGRSACAGGCPCLRPDQDLQGVSGFHL